jgi:hypothetical protein
MKNKKLKALIQKPLRFHHQDIHEELNLLKKHQVKSKWYYIFWGICTVSVVFGQLYVGLGYRMMAESNYNFIEFLKTELQVRDNDIRSF